VIGDVSGKGMPAALDMAMAHAHVRMAALRHAAPEECMAEVNRILVREKVSFMFATCFYCILNTLGETWEVSPQAIIEIVNSQILDFTAGVPQYDDITMVAVRLRRNGFSLLG
jgi:serine phosphatase RsbU (regulator of sigma subunit)